MSCRSILSMMKRRALVLVVMYLPSGKGPSVIDNKLAEGDMNCFNGEKYLR